MSVEGVVQANIIAAVRPTTEEDRQVTQMPSVR